VSSVRDERVEIAEHRRVAKRFSEYLHLGTVTQTVNAAGCIVSVMNIVQDYDTRVRPHTSACHQLSLKRHALARSRGPRDTSAGPKRTQLMQRSHAYFLHETTPGLGLIRHGQINCIATRVRQPTFYVRSGRVARLK
jgi:hypothetical protein